MGVIERELTEFKQSGQGYAKRGSLREKAGVNTEKGRRR